MSAEVILFHPGLGEAGGVSVDVQNLVDGIRRHGGEARALGRPEEIRQELQRHPRAIVHVFGCLPQRGIFAVMARARARRRILVWTPIFHPSRRKSWVGYGALRVMEAFDAVAPSAARLTDAVIAATSAEADFFDRVGAPRVELIPPGVPALPVNDSNAAVAAFRDRLGLKSGRIVLTVARDNSRKGLPFGFASFAALRQRIPDARLLLVGPDTDHPAAALPGVCCPGWLGPGEVELAYQLADVLFVPSLYEGLPRAVIEAWRVGTPVVASDRIALAPMVADGAGLVVPYANVARAADALAWLLQTPQEALLRGARGRELVKQSFLLDHVVEETVRLYEELAAA